MYSYRTLPWHCCWMSSGLPEIRVTRMLHPQGAPPIFDIYLLIAGVRAMEENSKVLDSGLCTCCNQKFISLCGSQEKESGSQDFRSLGLKMETTGKYAPKVSKNWSNGHCLKIPLAILILIYYYCFVLPEEERQDESHQMRYFIWLIKRQCFVMTNCSSRMRGVGRAQKVLSTRYTLYRLKFLF